jgi:hypothetical protein
MAAFRPGQRVRILHAAICQELIGHEAIVVDTHCEIRAEGSYGTYDVGVRFPGNPGIELGRDWVWTYSWAVTPILDDGANSLIDSEDAPVSDSLVEEFA